MSNFDNIGGPQNPSGNTSGVEFNSGAKLKIDEEGI